MRIVRKTKRNIRVENAFVFPLNPKRLKADVDKITKDQRKK